MWFQTILLATLSIAEYGKTLVSFFGKCNRSMRLNRPPTLYVRANSIEGLWLAAFLKHQRLAQEVRLVEEKMLPKQYLVKEEDFDVVDAAFRSVDVDIDWEPIPKKDHQQSTVETDKEWAMFSTTKKKSIPETSTEPEDDMQPYQPSHGWDDLSDRFRTQVDQYENLPNQQLMFVVDAREPSDSGSDFVSTLRQALRIIGVLAIEMDFLKMEYLFESMVRKDDATEQEEEEEGAEEAEEEEEQKETQESQKKDC